ncbi:unnamed protein product, partial [Rotaria sp. Silwood2]
KPSLSSLSISHLLIKYCLNGNTRWSVGRRSSLKALITVSNGNKNRHISSKKSSFIRE